MRMHLIARMPVWAAFVNSRDGSFAAAHDSAEILNSAENGKHIVKPERMQVDRKRFATE